ncbi:MAG: glycosyltransferase family 2 protein, partial [Crocinitomicaceae bacterium]|nr:glycosyltransferase family 2 protein [Crocinitomicaceae bacterium]
MSLVSVLLPNYNNAPYLRECLGSLRDQTFKDFIVVFVDDCSTDGSLEILNEYKELNLRVIKKQNNSGIVDTLNAGLDVIDSKYMIRMDGDDICALDRFEKLVDFMENNPEIGVCSSDIKTFGISSEVWHFESDPEMNKAKLIFGHGIGHASSIFRMSVLKENNIRYENLYWRMEDYLLFYKLKNVTKTTNIPEPLYFYRKGEYNENQLIREKKLAEFKKIYNRIFSETGLVVNDEKIDIHLALNRLQKSSFRINRYKKHCEEILKANSVSGNFPYLELKKILNKNIHQMVFRLIDENKITLKEILVY